MPESEPSMTSGRGGSQAGLSRLLLAFEVGQFRWFWSSTLFASMSMSVRMLAQGWLVLELTDSPFWVGFVAGIQGLGLLAFGVFGGAIADRFGKRRVLATVQLLSAIFAAAVGVLALTGHIDLWHMALAALGQGMVMATQLPVSNSMIYQIVGRQRLLNAMAMQQVGMNVTRIVGSLIAGTLIAQYGTGSSYIFAGLTALLGVGALWFVKGNFPATGRREPFGQAITHGLRYAWRATDIRRLLLLSVLMEAFGFSHFVMMPVMARDVLEVGPTGLGYLSAASGLGSTLSTVGVASLGDFKGKGPLLVGTAMSAGVFLALFAFSPWFAASLVLVALAGGSLMAYDVAMGTTLQLISDDQMRGRVMGLYGLTFGFTPVGGFLAGAVASVLTVSIALGGAGFIILAYVAVVAKSIVRSGQEHR